MSKIKILAVLLTLTMTALTVTSCGKEVEKKEKDSSSEAEVVSSTADGNKEASSLPGKETADTSKPSDDNSVEEDSSVVKGTGIIIEDFINLDELDDENVVIIGGDNETDNKTESNGQAEETESKDDVSSVPPNLEQGWGELL